MSEEVPSSEPATVATSTFVPTKEHGTEQFRVPVVTTTGKARKFAARMVEKKAAEAKEASDGEAKEGSQEAVTEGTASETPSAESDGAQTGKPEAPGGDVREGAEAGSGEAPKEDSPSLKAQFSALAKAEKRHREEFTAAKAELEKEKGELEEYRKLKQLAETDKFALPRYLGLDVTEWAKNELGQPVEAPKEAEKSLSPEFAELKKQQAELVQWKEQLHYETQKRNAVAQIDQLIQNEPERYEYTVARGGSDVVFATIEEHFHSTGQLIGFQAAADLVEEHFEKDAEGYASVAKFRKKLGSELQANPDQAPAATEAPVSSGKGETQPQAKQVTTTPDRISTGSLSKRERRKRAAALLAGN